MTLQHHEQPLPRMPEGHTGLVALPGTGRIVYWTGRVAIGLRHQQLHDHVRSLDALRWQALLLQGGAA